MGCKFLVVLALAAPAAGLVAPPTDMVSPTALRADASGMDGVIAPMGFFDPLGLSNRVNDQTLAWFRAAEIKHGPCPQRRPPRFCRAGGGEGRARARDDASRHTQSQHHSLA